MSVSHSVLLVTNRENVFDVYQSIFDAIQEYTVKTRNEVLEDYQVPNHLFLPDEVRDLYKLPVVHSYGFSTFSMTFSIGEHRKLHICPLGNSTSYDDRFGEGNKHSFSVEQWGKHQKIIDIVKEAVASYGTVFELVNDEVIS